MEDSFVNYMKEYTRNSKDILFKIPVNLWVTLYSEEQKCYHVESLEQTICKLQSEVNTGHRTSFCVVGVFSNFQDAINFEPFKN